MGKVAGIESAPKPVFMVSKAVCFFFDFISCIKTMVLVVISCIFVCKVCAANFGDICSVVGQQATEEMLVSHFLKDFSF